MKKALRGDANTVRSLW